MSKKKHLIRFLFLLLFAILAGGCQAPSVTAPPPEDVPTESQQTDADTTLAPPATAVEAEPPATQEPAAAQSTNEAAAQSTNETAATNTPQATFTPAAFGDLDPIFGVELAGGGFIEKAPLSAQAGSTWVRRNGLFWSDVEPNEGFLDWEAVADLEENLKIASESGLEMILIVRSTPPWAQGVPGTSCGPVHADKLEAFASFMEAAVARYSQPPYNVKYWEMGNEPDIDPRSVPPDHLFGCWGDRDEAYYGGEYYAEMLKVVYPRLKAADPEARLLVGGLLLDCDPNAPPVLADGKEKDCSPALFLEGILRNGGGDYFDGVSFHAYDFYYGADGFYGNINWASGAGQNGLIPVIVQKARYLRALLVQYGYPDKFLLNSETALLCGRGEDEPVCKTEEFELLKAYYAAQSYAVAAAEGLRANIWYHLVRGWRASGLMENLTDFHPAYYAFQVSGSQLDRSQFWGQVAGFEGIYGNKYIRDRDGVIEEVWVLWSLDGESRVVDLQSTPAAIFDVFGEPQELTQLLEIGVAPVYLVWQR